MIAIIFGIRLIGLSQWPGASGSLIGNGIANVVVAAWETISTTTARTAAEGNRGRPGAFDEVQMRLPLRLFPAIAARTLHLEIGTQSAVFSRIRR
jgi:hypothetical protein